MESFAERRERELVAAAEAWDMDMVVDAGPGDVPTIDLAAYLAAGAAAGNERRRPETEALAEQVGRVGRTTGFHLLTGHGIDPGVIDDAFAAAAAFLTLPSAAKLELAMDRPGSIPGTGYLRVGERRLPRRARGNLNEAVVFKQDRAITLAHNSWPDERLVPGFREAVERYAIEVERVARSLLPIYARALDLPGDFFASAFVHPFSRLRLTRYPPVTDPAPDVYGIAPHVDTTFFTLLAQSGPGLVIFGEARRQWMRVPAVPGALVVNTGELLKQWSNDHFVSAKHFVAPHPGPGDRYSIPFFFNATADHRMVCLPSCHGPDDPPKYPPVSYLESQAAAQRE